MRESVFFKSSGNLYKVDLVDTFEMGRTLRLCDVHEHPACKTYPTFGRFCKWYGLSSLALLSWAASQQLLIEEEHVVASLKPMSFFNQNRFLKQSASVVSQASRPSLHKCNLFQKKLIRDPQVMGIVK